MITVLVITDGAPDNRDTVRHTIVAAANRLHTKEELSLSLIQVGDSHGASEFLCCLDEDLHAQHEARFDIADTLSYTQMQREGLSFRQVIARSVQG